MVIRLPIRSAIRKIKSQKTEHNPLVPALQTRSLLLLQGRYLLLKGKDLYLMY
jgi:hypothetical protein